MQDLHTNPYVLLLWSRLLRKATVYNALALEAGGQTILPLPMTPDIMIRAYRFHCLFQTLEPGQNIGEFLTGLGTYIEDMIFVYETSTISLVEQAALNNGRLATALKIEQRVHEIGVNGCTAQA